MSETLPEAHHAAPHARETSDEKVWQTPRQAVVETALDTTAHALGDR
ncbi:pyrroloquinoline quinone precursor peptide PqqA [Streptomyces sp. NPDC088350]